MGDLLNLNKARKARAAKGAKARAAENRVSFGRSKAERSLSAAEQAKAARELDAKKRED
jgi:hypothetical protein